MIGIAVLGCGRIGAMHAANIAAHPRAYLGAFQASIAPLGGYAVSEDSGSSVDGAHVTRAFGTVWRCGRRADGRQSQPRCRGLRRARSLSCNDRLQVFRPVDNKRHIVEPDDLLHIAEATKENVYGAARLQFRVLVDR